MGTVPATPDGLSSMCRISTDSAKSASRVALEPSMYLNSASPSTYPLAQGAHSNPVLDLSAVRDSPAKTREVSLEGLGHFANIERPWELPPKEFLAQWRRSRSSSLPGNSSTATPGTPQRSVSHMHDVSVPQS